MIYIHDISGETPQKNFTFDINCYLPGFNDELEGIKWALYDPTALLTFSNKSLILFLRSQHSPTPQFFKILHYQNILDANFLSNASNCTSPLNVLLDICILSGIDNKFHIINWQTIEQPYREVMIIPIQGQYV